MADLDGPPDGNFLAPLGGFLLLMFFIVFPAFLRSDRVHLAACLTDFLLLPSVICCLKARLSVFF